MRAALPASTEHTDVPPPVRTVSFPDAVRNGILGILASLLIATIMWAVNVEGRVQWVERDAATSLLLIEKVNTNTGKVAVLESRLLAIEQGLTKMDGKMDKLLDK